MSDSEGIELTVMGNAAAANVSMPNESTTVLVTHTQDAENNRSLLKDVNLILTLFFANFLVMWLAGVVMVSLPNLVLDLHLSSSSMMWYAMTMFL